MRHGLFFAHLALEKSIKAHLCRLTEQLPPRIHNLLRLYEKSNLELNEKQKDFIAKFDRYQLEGR
ncbi:MAG: HEPN domain-containing protein [Thermodesulfobacteriota bacterium]